MANEKRLIDANDVIAKLTYIIENRKKAGLQYKVLKVAYIAVAGCDNVDAVEVVRCKDCKKGRPIDKSKRPEKYFRADCVVCECEDVVGNEPMIYEPMHYCSYGDRKDGAAP